MRGGMFTHNSLHYPLPLTIPVPVMRTETLLGLTAHGFHKISYTDWGDPTNGRVVIDVRDRGPGIPREEHGVIFEKFGRAKNAASCVRMWRAAGAATGSITRTIMDTRNTWLMRTR